MNLFSDILEQTRAKTEFRDSFRRNRLNHAYLLTGSYGVGKLSLARAVAARYLCDSPHKTDSCGQCRSCTLLQHGNHPDYLELPRDTTDLKIGLFTPRPGSGSESFQQQTVLEFMRLKPLNGRGRVCIIPDCERINNEAANAFLKTLEEPPPESLIILTTSNKNRLLTTITSRCRIVGLSRLSQEAINTYLLNQKDIQTQDAAELSMLAEGSLGQALAFTRNDTLENWRQICSISNYQTPAEAVRFARNLTRIVKSSKDSTAKRTVVLQLLDLLSLYVRRQMRDGLSPRNGYHALQHLWNAGDILSANVRPELVTLNAVINMIAAIYKG